MPYKKQKAIRSNKKYYLRPNDRFGLNAKIKLFRANFRGVTEKEFFLFRVAKIFA